MYFGCNSLVDREIGRVIDAVHAYASDNTYIGEIRGGSSGV